MNWEGFPIYSHCAELGLLQERKDSEKLALDAGHLPRAQSVVVAGAERAYSTHCPLDTMGRHSGWGSDTPQQRSWTKRSIDPHENAKDGI